MYAESWNGSSIVAFLFGRGLVVGEMRVGYVCFRFISLRCCRCGVRGVRAVCGDRGYCGEYRIAVGEVGETGETGATNGGTGGCTGSRRSHPISPPQ